MPAGEANTFSKLIDDAIARSRRPGLILDIIGYANSTIRECEVLAFFKRDLVEDQLTADASPFIWEHPLRFRMLRTAFYLTKNIYPGFVQPGLKQEQYETPYFYYGASTYIVFAGVDVGDLIDVAYYEYLRRLRYYEDTTGNRPAYFDDSTETWYYWDGSAYVTTLGTTALDLAAQALVTNWLVFNWYDTILEGTLAKLFKDQQDPRSPTSFALYKSYQKSLSGGEPYESLGY
jgi:hypothetical protein